MTKRGRISNACRASVFILFGGLAPCVARADVLDIGSDGTITTYNAPAVYDGSGVHTIGYAALPRLSHAIVPTQGSSPDVENILNEAAQRYALDTHLLHAVAWTESRFHANAVSPKGAIGVMQLMPETARLLGVEPKDPKQNIFGGAAYLRAMLDRYRGSSILALAAYNAGPSAVDKFGGVPPFQETQNYVRRILNLPEAPISGGQTVSNAADPSSFVLFVNP